MCWHLQCAAYGNFSGAKAQELLVSRGKVLELLRPNESGKLQTVLTHEVFGCIRSLAVFRMTGAPTDHILVGSDSGRIVLLKYNKERNAFQKVHQVGTYCLVWSVLACEATTDQLK